MIKAVVFDFGGVLAEEGFKEGIAAIGRMNGLNPEEFFSAANELVYDTGYVTGQAEESAYWNAIREKTGIQGDDRALRQEILKRFLLRPEMLTIVEKLRSSGFTTAILSDQTNWLDEMNQHRPFYRYFDYVFNSFKLKKGKRDPTVFRDICSAMGVQPGEVLFVDDNIENTERALGEGLRVIHFKDIANFQREIKNFIEITSVQDN